ncbi:MAG: hypothetical protein Q8L22_06920 [Reyranella sp.]|nr:hypothetical protein [Reyranella sp.]
METDLAHDLETLHREAVALKAAADAATRTYDRETWIRLALVFFPVPFIIVLLRLHLEAWGYYVAGGLLVASAALLVALDGAAAAKRDRAVQAAERARKAYDDARAAR